MRSWPRTAVGSGLDNYDVEYADGALTVNLRDLTITANDRSKTYGNELMLGRPGVRHEPRRSGQR